MKCPGQDSRYWGPEAISEAACAHCGAPVEFFKDESSRKCRKCGAKVLNPKMDFGCASYCRFAAQCLGEDLPPELLARRDDLLKDRVAAEVKRFLGRDFKRIGRTLKVVEYAGKIQQSEGGDPAIVTLAACLSVLGGTAAAFSGNSAFTADEIETAKTVLSRAGAPEEPAGEALSILANLGGSVNSASFRCVSDAVRIANAAEAIKAGGHDEAWITDLNGFLTRAGKEIMERVISEITVRRDE